MIRLRATLLAITLAAVPLIAAGPKPTAPPPAAPATPDILAKGTKFEGTKSLTPGGDRDVQAAVRKHEGNLVVLRIKGQAGSIQDWHLKVDGTNLALDHIQQIKGKDAISDEGATGLIDGDTIKLAYSYTLPDGSRKRAKNQLIRATMILKRTDKDVGIPTDDK